MAPDGIDVRAHVDSLSACLLGRHVPRRPDDRPGHREPVRGADVLRDPEVEQLDEVAIATAPDPEAVLRFDAASTIAYRQIDRDALPAEAELRTDLEHVLDAYEHVIDVG
jgi:hypothetical protein